MIIVVRRVRHRDLLGAVLADPAFARTRHRRPGRLARRLARYRAHGRHRLRAAGT